MGHTAYGGVWLWPGSPLYERKTVWQTYTNTRVYISYRIINWAQVTARRRRQQQQHKYKFCARRIHMRLRGGLSIYIMFIIWKLCLQRNTTTLYTCVHYHSGKRGPSFCRLHCSFSLYGLVGVVFFSSSSSCILDWIYWLRMCINMHRLIDSCVFICILVRISQSNQTNNIPTGPTFDGVWLNVMADLRFINNIYWYVHATATILVRKGTHFIIKFRRWGSSSHRVWQRFWVKNILLVSDSNDKNCF